MCLCVPQMRVCRMLREEDSLCTTYSVVVMPSCWNFVTGSVAIDNCIGTSCCVVTLKLPELNPHDTVDSNFQHQFHSVYNVTHSKTADSVHLSLKVILQVTYTISARGTATTVMQNTFRNKIAYVLSTRWSFFTF